jgi:hypothetical protein
MHTITNISNISVYLFFFFNLGLLPAHRGKICMFYMFVDKFRPLAVFYGKIFKIPPYQNVDQLQLIRCVILILPLRSFVKINVN